ncbi:hypothetical protein V8F06_001046 [Rhypophila decipiens]
MIAHLHWRSREPIHSIAKLKRRVILTAYQVGSLLGSVLFHHAEYLTVWGPGVSKEKKEKENKETGLLLLLVWSALRFVFKPAIVGRYEMVGRKKRGKLCKEFKVQRCLFPRSFSFLLNFKGSVTHPSHHIYARVSTLLLHVIRNNKREEEKRSKAVGVRIMLYCQKPPLQCWPMSNCPLKDQKNK